MATSTLPAVKPILCNSELTFTEWQRVVSQLMARDRTLEESFLALTNELSLSELSATLRATRILLNEALVDEVGGSDTLPSGVDDYRTFQQNVKDQLSVLENRTLFSDSDGVPRSVRTLALSNQTNIANINTKLDEFDEQLASFAESAAQIAQTNEFVTNVEARISDIEELLADLAEEINNARKEFSDDPSRRLVDKIDAIDSNIRAINSRQRNLVKEVTDARAPDRFDTLAERMGSLESEIENLNELITVLQGAGTVTGIRSGRSTLHGNVELIPGANIAISRERNGFRIDVVDFGTCVDYGAPKIDPNFGCCTPNNPNFGN